MISFQQIFVAECIETIEIGIWLLELISDQYNTQYICEGWLNMILLRHSMFLFCIRPWWIFLYVKKVSDECNTQEMCERVILPCCPDPEYS